MIPGSGRSPRVRHGNPLSSGESTGQRSSEGYSPWGHTESDTTEEPKAGRTSTYTQESCHPELTNAASVFRRAPAACSSRGGGQSRHPQCPSTGPSPHASASPRRRAVAEPALGLEPEPLSGCCNCARGPPPPGPPPDGIGGGSPHLYTGTPQALSGMAVWCGVGVEPWHSSCCHWRCWTGGGAGRALGSPRWPWLWG